MDLNSLLTLAFVAWQHGLFLIWTIMQKVPTMHLTHVKTVLRAKASNGLPLGLLQVLQLRPTQLLTGAGSLRAPKADPTSDSGFIGSESPTSKAYLSCLWSRRVSGHSGSWLCSLIVMCAARPSFLKRQHAGTTLQYHGSSLPPSSPLPAKVRSPSPDANDFPRSL